MLYIHMCIYIFIFLCARARVYRAQGQRSDRGLAYLSLARLGLAAGPGLWLGAPDLWYSVREVVKEGLADERRDFCPQSLACLEVEKLTCSVCGVLVRGVCMGMVRGTCRAVQLVMKAPQHC